VLQRLYRVDEQLQAIREQLQHPAIEDAQTISRLRDTIAAVQAEHHREHKPAGRRDRTGHQMRVRGREQQLQELHDRETRLLERVPDPQATLEHAEQLRREQSELMREQLGLAKRAVDEQLERRPPWLERTLGPEPTDMHLREQWQKTAREIAAHRIEHRITDPRVAFSEHARDNALKRAVSDTRAALGLEPAGGERERGIGL
jgi:hypothetical protein